MFFFLTRLMVLASPIIFLVHFVNYSQAGSVGVTAMAAVIITKCFAHVYDMAIV